MARSAHANLTADQRAERRARRAPRRTERRQGTLSAVIASAVADHTDVADTLEDFGLQSNPWHYAAPPLVRTASGSVELRRWAA